MSNALIDAAKAPALAYGDKNWDKLRSAVTSDHRYDEVATQRNANGADAFVDLCRGWAAAFPDSKPDFRNAVAGGDTVVLELTWTGTHTGPLATPNGEVAPTGRSINIRAVQVVEVRDGKAASTRQYFDMATMMSQLGLAN